MATEAVNYLSFFDALVIHFDTMDSFGEERYGVFSRALIESALGRPRHAATYENAGLIRQAATLCFGLIKNHPWNGGNKRTATAITAAFLDANGWQTTYTPTDAVELVLAVEANRYGVDEIEAWYRQHVQPIN